METQLAAPIALVKSYEYISITLLLIKKTSAKCCLQILFLVAISIWSIVLWRLLLALPLVATVLALCRIAHVPSRRVSERTENLDSKRTKRRSKQKRNLENAHDLHEQRDNASGKDAVVEAQHLRRVNEPP